MQNEKTLQQLIQEYEASMPPDIMNIIKAFDWKKEVRTIVNQNQLMIDVGADLEQSIYLMILGAVQVGELYERLIETHEIPEDKTRKIIEEIEVQIFNPLHKKLIEIDGVEDKKVSQAEPVSREDILAEIEKEPEPIKPKITFQIPQAQSTPSVSKPPQHVEDPGITKPFSISSHTTVDAKELELPTGKIAEGVQEDPIHAGLTQATATTQPVQKPATLDPYREPIE